MASVPEMTMLGPLGAPGEAPSEFGFHWLLFPVMDPVVGAWHPQRGFAPNGYWTFTCGAVWRPELDPMTCKYLGRVQPPVVAA